MYGDGGSTPASYPRQTFASPQTLQNDKALISKDLRPAHDTIDI